MHTALVDDTKSIAEADAARARVGLREHRVENANHVVRVIDLIEFIAAQEPPQFFGGGADISSAFQPREHIT